MKSINKFISLLFLVVLVVVFAVIEFNHIDVGMFVLGALGIFGVVLTTSVFNAISKKLDEDK